jgi:hypothetical protein
VACVIKIRDGALFLARVIATGNRAPSPILPHKRPSPSLAHYLRGEIQWAKLEEFAPSLANYLRGRKLGKIYFPQFYDEQIIKMAAYWRPFCHKFTASKSIFMERWDISFRQTQESPSLALYVCEEENGKIFIFFRFTTNKHIKKAAI